MDFKSLNWLDDIKFLHDAFQKLTEGIEGYSMILLDPEGEILTWNKGVEKLKGYTAKEIIGQQISIFYTPLDREKKMPEKLLSEARITGTARHVGRRVRKNGTIFWGSIEVASIKDSAGKVIGFTKSARELNEVRDVGHFWFDIDGILNIKTSPFPHSKEKMQEFLSLMLTATRGAKVCCIADLREAILTDEGTGSFITALSQLCKAIAFVTNQKVDANTKKILPLLSTDIPARTFTEWQEAKNWITHYACDWANGHQ
jgi:PAS domain S-box-containing protein